MIIGETIYIEPAFVKRGRPTIAKTGEAMTRKMRKAKERAEKKQEQLESIAILDMETDPFDAEHNGQVKPFLAVLYGEKFDPVVIWTENQSEFVERVLRAIMDLPGKYTIYAHNGGKFDYMFLLHRLRGQVTFKGRGIMSAKIGNHEIRDSFHIIPERLANWQKDDFDYSKMKRKNRAKHKREIIDYCINDCAYLLDIVKKFVENHGFKLSIGQAAMAYLRKDYKVDRIGDAMDNFLRQYFFGGRVECLAGKGHFVGDYKLYDVNSMYPYVMSNFRHPIGNMYTVNDGGKINAETCAFVELSCDNFGALVRRGDENETSGNFRDGKFFTTIHEYRVARKYGLIANAKIWRTINCDKFSSFERTIVPLYDGRVATKAILKTLERQGLKGSYEYNETKKDDMIIKFLLNNMYGKFAQNPRRYKEHYITMPDECPPDEWFKPKGWREDDIKNIMLLPSHECDEYWIWERPNPAYRFNNVGTAASITGAARSVLLEAIQNAVDPIYCDTDSLICKELRNVQIDGAKLGAWDIEQEFDEVIITGKKMYACKVKGKADGHKDRFKIRSKGVSDRQWDDYVRMLDGQVIEVLNKGITMKKTGEQFYMRRNIRATGPIVKNRNARYRDRQFIAG